MPKVINASLLRLKTLFGVTLNFENLDEDSILLPIDTSSPLQKRLTMTDYNKMEPTHIKDSTNMKSFFNIESA